MQACVTFQTFKSQPPWILFFFSIGAFFILRSSFAFLNWIYVSFLRPPKNLKKYGSWALITGPTDGIGKGFAFELARKGMNLILVGRNSDKLKQVSFSIQSKYADILVKIIVIDFAGDIDDGIKTIGETLDGLEIGILVNNVGVSYPYAKFFHELDEETLRNLIRINVDGTTRVTQTVIHRLVARKKGAIVNLGSGAATVLPSDPLYSVYAATKAYIDQFSRSLYVEYKKSGIDVQCQAPLYVATRMASIRRSSFFVPSTETYARAGVRRIGYEPRCTPYWPHSILWCLASLIPECAIDYWRLGFCLRIRHKGQLKDSIKNE